MKNSGVCAFAHRFRRHRFEFRPLPSILVMLAFAMCAGFSASRAQEAGGRFDPVVFIATLNLFQNYGEGVFAMPPHTERHFLDSIKTYEHTVGFTMVTRDSNPDGWAVRMYFDANRFGSVVFTGLSASRTLSARDTQYFKRLIYWIERRLGEKLLDRQSISPAHVVWKWMARPNFLFEAVRRADRKSGKALVSMNLRFNPEQAPDKP